MSEPYRSFHDKETVRREIKGFMWVFTRESWGDTGSGQVNVRVTARRAGLAVREHTWESSAPIFYDGQGWEYQG